MSTPIEWTDETWNPTRGCSRVSPGCFCCYAERVAVRFKEGPFRGFATIVNGRPAWTGKVELVEPKLLEPLKWRKPRRIFVNSMSDLFHESLPDEAIDRVFAVMALCPQHTFQILTKRADRMLSYLGERSADDESMRNRMDEAAQEFEACHADMGDPKRWPLPNVWLGVSVENQRYADERIPLLLQTTAAVRFVSYEPALGPIDFTYPDTIWPNGPQMCCSGAECGCLGLPIDPPLIYGIDWVIVGGESGPGARPFDIEWATTTVDQCKRANMACFVKQLGAKPMLNGAPYNPHGVCKNDLSGEPFGLYDRKGGNMLEWPEDIRVREFPTTATEVSESSPEVAA